MVSYTGPGDRLFQGVLLDATKRWEAKINASFCPFHPFSLEPFLAIQMWIAIVLFVLSFHWIAFQLFSHLFLFISAMNSFCNHVPRGWAEQEPSICTGTGYPVPVFQIPVPAEPVPDIWQEKSRKICNSLNLFQGITFTFWIKMHRKKFFLLIFLIVLTSMPLLPVAQRQKQDIPYSHKYLVSFPLNP